MFSAGEWNKINPPGCAKTGRAEPYVTRKPTGGGRTRPKKGGIHRKKTFPPGPPGGAECRRHQKEKSPQKSEKRTGHQGGKSTDVA